MKVTIAIPIVSPERIPLLIQAVESIQSGTYKNVHPVVVIDGNSKIHKTLNGKLHDITIIINEKRMDWVFSVNRVMREFDSDYYIYTADDIIFPPDCIEGAMEVLQKRFPNGDGVVNLWKKGRGIVGLFGRKWADHFPRREVLCPDFVHYGADTEFFRVANELGKIVNLPKRIGRIKHFRLKDETQRLVRKAENGDNKICRKRADKDYKWGIDFRLITKERK